MINKKKLIQNALLYTGDPAKPATIQHVLINSEGIIEKIYTSPPPTDQNTIIINAEGKWLVPGFIDSHTHYDAEVIAAPGLNESARHGVTTIILGSCSVSAIYNNAEDTSDSFTRVEAIPREIMYPLLQNEKKWHTPKDWISYINQLPLGINIASFIGHSDIRMKAMGIHRSLQEGEKATKSEEEAMAKMLEEALDVGFLGLSTMDNPWDKMDGERYWSHKTPSYYASWKERKKLINILRKRGAILQGAPNLVTRVNAIRYMLASTGWFRKPLKTTMIALMDLIGDRYIFPVVSFVSMIINKIGKGDFRMQSPPCPFTVYYDGVDSVMFEEFPSGEAMRHLAREIDLRNELIHDPAFRSNFKHEIKRKFAPKVWHKDLSLSVIIDAPDSSMVGKNFYQIAEENKEHPVDTFLDLIVEHDKKIKWTTTIANDRKEKYKDLYNCPYNLISFSDAGAHLNNMAFYNFPLKMIKVVYDSIQANNPIMPMEKCIWRLTKELADWFEIDRGYIAEGKKADLVLLDPTYFHNITEDVENANIEAFGNYPRLVNRNKGVVNLVMVNGNVIFKNDKFIDGYGIYNRYGTFICKHKQSTE